MTRLLHHLSLGISDIGVAAAFYDAALGALGFQKVWAGKEGLGYGLVGDGEGTAGFEESLNLFLVPDLIVPGAGFHLALMAETRAQVDAFYAAALEADGRDNGPPGLRPHYAEDYYAAFVFDPFGYKLEAVCNWRSQAEARLL